MMTIEYHSLPKKIRSFFLPLAMLVCWQMASYAQVTVTLTVQPPLCGGINNGMITANPSGGTTPYSYSWNNGANTQIINNLPPGTYSVTVTAANGLTGTASTVMTAPAPLVVDPVVTNCGLPGAMTAIVSGGVQPYNYSWSTGATTQSISNLNPGSYCVTVVDGNSCAFFICESIGTLLTATVNTTNIVCGSGSGGTAQALISGGVTPYGYLWSNGATTPGITNLPQGTYTVTATAANGCTTSASGTVGYQPGNYNVALSINHPTCPGTSNGSISASAAGGQPPHNYAWSNGQSGATITNLFPGTYVVTATDAFGCTATQTATLAYQSNLNATLTTWNPSCSNSNNGSVSVNPTGGIQPYAFLWSTGATDQTLNNVGAGTYTVTVSDVLGCTTVKTATLTAPPPMTVTVTGTNATNCGVANGMATAVPGGGGSPPFSYLWSNGASTNVITGLAAGNYTVTVSSVAGCTATGSVTITSPNALNVSISGSSLVCGNANNGILTANITFGTPPYAFAWSNGGSSQTISALPAGTYVVTVTSSQSCTGTASKTIAGSPPINLTAVPENPKCFGTATGKITATATGGTPPLAYHWSNGASGPIATNLVAGNYTLTVVDAQGCQRVEDFLLTHPSALGISFNHSGGSCGGNGFISAGVSGGTQPYTFAWNSGQNESVIFDLPAGNYTLTVTDANTCQAVASQSLASFPALNLTATATNTTCNGTTDGTATAVADNGTAPISFLWNNGATTSELTALSPGTYQVTATDVNGCKSADTVQVLLGAGLNLEIEGTYFICPGMLGEATVTPFGGTPPYVYLWSNGQTSQTATNLTPSQYKVTVTDQLGCNGETNILLLPGGGFGINWAFENAVCFGTATGSASVGVTSGGIPPFQYEWSNGDTLPQIDSLLAGEYVVTITDSTGCTSSQTFNVGQPNLLQVEVAAFDGNCGSNGYANANVSGGSNPFIYAWNNGTTTQSAGNLPPGIYSVTVTDAHECVAVDSGEIHFIPIPACNIELTQPIGAINGSDGQLTVQLDPGALPFTVKWSDGGQTTQTAVGLSPGNHIATVTDANNCTAICNFTLYNPGEVGDFAWLDTDKDGIQDVAETGLAGALVTLRGANQYGDTVEVQTISDANGSYGFVAQPGTYKLLFMPPAGYANSPFNQTGNDFFDSDPNPLTFATGEFVLGQGESNLSVDGGFYVAEPCENFTSPGGICCDQNLCGPGQPVEVLAETAAPAGGSGDAEFLWMSSHLPPPFDLNTWTPLLDASAASLDPGMVQQDAWFIRLARRKGCIEYLESNIVHLSVDSVAIAEIIATDTTCLDVPVDFSAAENPGATYAWSFEGAAPDTADAQHVHGVTWAEFGEKKVTLSVSKDGCLSMDEVTVFVSNIPIFCGDALIINAELYLDTAVVVDWYYSFTDSVTRTFSVEWKWEDDEYVSIGGVDSTFQIDGYLHFKTYHPSPKRGRNSYRVRLTDSNGTVLISNEVEVIYKGDYSLVHVFPNPFGGDLQVEILDRYDRRITMELFSPEGKSVGIYEAPEKEDRMSLPTGNLPPGVYFLFVKYDNEPQKIVKLIKWRP